MRLLVIMSAVLSCIASCGGSLATSKADIAADARSWTSKFAEDASSVQRNVASVQPVIGSIGMSPQSAVTASKAWAAAVQHCREQLDQVSLDLEGSLSEPSKAVKTQIRQGVDGLEAAMGSLGAYLMDGKAAALTAFRTEYFVGVVLWNKSVTTLWSQAARKPPTL